jgi:hypothetical protein
LQACYIPIKTRIAFLSAVAAAIAKVTAPTLIFFT